jgi:hypothetical protein
MLRYVITMKSSAFKHPKLKFRFVPKSRKFINLSLCFLLIFSWDETESTWYCDHPLAFVEAPDDRLWWLWSNRWNANWQGKRKYSEKTCPSATLSITNPTWPDPGSNLSLRPRKLATNCLSYGKALLLWLLWLLFVPYDYHIFESVSATSLIHAFDVFFIIDCRKFISTSNKGLNSHKVDITCDRNPSSGCQLQTCSRTGK